MKKSEVKMILILLLVSVVIIGGIFLWKRSGSEGETDLGGTQTGEQNTEIEEYVQQLSDGSKLNISEQLAKNKTLDGLEFSNIQLLENGGITTLLADVKNNTGAALTEQKTVMVEVLDKQGNVITRIPGYVDPMGAGESVQLNTACGADVANAYDFRVVNP